MSKITLNVRANFSKLLKRESILSTEGANSFEYARMHTCIAPSTLRKEAATVHGTLKGVTAYKGL